MHLLLPDISFFESLKISATLFFALFFLSPLFFYLVVVILPVFCIFVSVALVVKILVFRLFEDSEHLGVDRFNAESSRTDDNSGEFETKEVIKIELPPIEKDDEEERDELFTREDATWHTWILKFGNTEFHRILWFWRNLEKEEKRRRQCK